MCSAGQRDASLANLPYTDEFFVTVESSPGLLWRLVITSLDHIHIRAGDPLATIRFYESCLGAEHLGSTLDHVPADLPDKLAPKLVAHLERVDGDPKLREYYARFT